MKVIDVIELSAKLLNEMDTKKCVEFCKFKKITMSQLLLLPATSENADDLLKPDFLTEQVERELRLFLDCINIVQTEIASEKDYLFATQEIEVKNGKLDIDTLSQKLFKIKEITSGDEKIFYEFIGGNILLKDGIYKIKYAYLPSEIDFDGDIETHYGKISVLNFCYGVCNKYLLIKNMFNEASLWQEKFDKSIAHCFKKIGEIKIKNRRWLWW